MVDAEKIFNENEIAELRQLIEIHGRIKELSDQEEVLKKKYKAEMTNKNVDNVKINGKFIELRPSIKKSIPKKLKDDFIKELIKLGKKHLLKTEINVDIDSVLAERDARQIDSDLVDKYVKVTESKAMYLP